MQKVQDGAISWTHGCPHQKQMFHPELSDRLQLARRVHSPPFSRRGGCAINKKILFLSGAGGVVSKFQQNRCAARISIRCAMRPWTKDFVTVCEGRGLRSSPNGACANKPEFPTQELPAGRLRRISHEWQARRPRR